MSVINEEYCKDESLEFNSKIVIELLDKASEDFANPERRTILNKHDTLALVISMQREILALADMVKKLCINTEQLVSNYIDEPHNITREELLSARKAIQLELAKDPLNRDLQTTAQILNEYRISICPKGRDTACSCYEMCGYRENGACTINDDL